MNSLRQNQWIAYLSCGLFSASQALLFVMYPVLAEKIGLSLSQIVGCFTLGSFLFLWGGPYWAMRSDSEGRSKILRFAQTGVLISQCALIVLLSPLKLGTALSFVILLLSRLVYGALGSGVVPVSQALAMEVTAEGQKTKAAATYSMFLNLGRMLGPIIGLVLISISPMFLVVLFSLLFLVLIVLTRKTLRPHILGEARSLPRLRDIWPKTAEMQSVVGLGLLTTVFLGILQSSLGAYLQTAYQLSAAESSHFMAKLLITAALTTVAVQFTMRSKLKNPWQGSLPFGALALFFGLILFLSYPHTLVLYAAIIIMSLGIALLTPSYTSAMSYFAGSEQGKASGALSAAHTLGYSIGGGLSALGLLYSSKAPFFIALLVSLGIFATFPAIYRVRAFYTSGVAKC